MAAQKALLPLPVVIVRKKRPTAAPARTLPRPGASKPAPPHTGPMPPPPPQPPTSVPLQPSHPSATVSLPNLDERDAWQRSIQEKYELLGILRDRWPHTFPADFRLVKPFAQGVHKEIQRALPEVKPALLRRTIHFFQRGGKGAYWGAILQGGPRYS